MEDAPNETMTEVKDFDATYEMVTDFRKDYDKLMDAVHYFSLMRGTSHEDDAIARLKKAYQENQDKWGG
jgi:uncharacterized protein YihD (DUF1040 family)